MPRFRFVSPESVKIDISDGDWIEIKRQLTNGEQKAVNRAAFRSRYELTDGDTGSSFVEMDMGSFALAKLGAYLVDWSFKDERGKDVKLTPDAMRNLDQETAAEIEAAIDTHIETLAAEKKDLNTEAASILTLP